MAGYRPSYNIDEDNLLLKIIAKTGLYYELKGKNFWVDISKIGCFDRTWMSLENRFVNWIIPNIYNKDFDIPEDEKTKIWVAWNQLKHDFWPEKAGKWKDSNDDSHAEDNSDSENGSCNEHEGIEIDHDSDDSSNSEILTSDDDETSIAAPMNVSNGIQDSDGESETDLEEGAPNEVPAGFYDLLNDDDEDDDETCIDENEIIAANINDDDVDDENDVDLEKDEENESDKDEGTTLLNENECVKDEETTRLNENECVEDKDTTRMNENEYVEDKDTTRLNENEYVEDKDTTLLNENECVRDKETPLLNGNEYVKDKEIALLNENECVKDKETTLLNENDDQLEMQIESDPHLDEDFQ